MFNISSFLERFKKIYTKEVEVLQVICDVCKEIAGISCSPKEVLLKNGTVYLNIAPTAKNHLFIRREKILTELQKRIPGCVYEIR